MGKSTDRTRKRTRRRTGAGGSSSGGIQNNPWFDIILSLLTPTPQQRHDWERNRQDTWTLWANTPTEERPKGSRMAPLAAIVIDWENHLGPVDLSHETLDEYRELAGPGFEECQKFLRKFVQ